MSSAASPMLAGKEAAGLDGEWQRLHPLSAVVRASRGALAVVVVFLTSRSNTPTTEIVHIAAVALVLLGGLVVWLVTRWRVSQGALQIETGLLRRSSLRLPLSQVQAIDIVRPGLARLLGMSELRLRMAGGGGRVGRLAYLPEGVAERLRASLLAVAHGLHEDTPPPPERPLFRVSTPRLVSSVAISGTALVVEAAVVALVIVAVIAPGAAAGALSATGATLLTAATAAWRRFNGQFGLTVAEAPDGLRVRGGLVETDAETIPAGRVQALRLVQPFTWRPFGWYRLEVDVAGRGTAGRQNRAARMAARTLVPVGTENEALAIAGRIIAGPPVGLTPPPRRARWKSPLRYSKLSAGMDGVHLCTTSGRLRRITCWVPLAKVQSIRWVQGPVERRLRLATIHVDTAGRSVFAALRDRDESEAETLLARLPGACREARRR